MSDGSAIQRKKKVYYVDKKKKKTFQLNLNYNFFCFSDWRKRSREVGKLAAPCGPTARVQLGTGPSLLPGKVKYTGSDR